MAYTHYATCGGQEYTFRNDQANFQAPGCTMRRSPDVGVISYNGNMGPGLQANGGNNMFPLGYTSIPSGAPPGFGGGILGTVVRVGGGILGGLASSAVQQNGGPAVGTGTDRTLLDLACKYAPNATNIALPGTPCPTPDTRTPAPALDPAARYAGAACPSGFHMNKGTYWTKQGVVYKGTRCVKNRRMNPTNARALGRAIRRGDSFVRLAKGFGMTAPAKGLKKRRCR